MHEKFYARMHGPRDSGNAKAKSVAIATAIASACQHFYARCSDSITKDVLTT